MYDLIVIGSSTGGIEAIITILAGLPDNFKVPIVFVQHQDRNSQSNLSNILKNRFAFEFVDVEDKLKIEKAKMYLAPPDYHLQIEMNKTFSLSLDEPVHYSRPSIDVLFETAAEVYRSNLIGVLLTGANSDGADGLLRIQENGGYVLVQDPSTAISAEMPKSGINATHTEHIYYLQDIATQLLKILKEGIYD